MEIEIRAFIEDIEEFKARLEKIGATFVEEKHIVDHWFCREDKKSFDEVLQKHPGDYSLRIRTLETDSGVVCELNSKVLEKLDDHNAFHEYETAVSDFGQTKQILLKCGFKIFSIMDKKRNVYKFEKCLINIEDIKDYRPAVELEIVAGEDVEKHKAYLIGLLDRLGVKQKDRIEKSITYHYMKAKKFL
ncbi:MAG: class IV adenylate cyclase [archaeon]